MRLVALAAAVSLAVALAAQPAAADTTGYRGQVLADNPGGYWRLGDSGSTAADQTGASPGTYVGGVTLGRPGALAGDPDTAAGFDGSTGTVQIPNGPALNPSSAITLEAWVRPSALPASAATIVRKDGQYSLRLKQDGTLVFRLWKAGVVHDVASAAGAAHVGSWTYVAGTWDGATMTIYVNGAAQGSASLAAPIAATTSRLWIGSTYNSYEYVAADLDEVAVYPTALPAARVQAHYQAGAQPPPPSYASTVIGDAPNGYWRLGDSGSVAADEIGRSPGSYLGGVTLGLAGAIWGDANAAAGFDGATGTVSVPSTTALTPTTALSLETWIRPTSLPTSSNSILRKEGEYALRLGYDGSLVFRLWKGGTAYSLSTPPKAAAVGSWTDLLATWDGATMTIYLNGLPKASMALAGPIDSRTSALYLGSTYNSFDWFSGGLDEVAVYAKALGADRAAAHYAAGAPPDSTPPVVGLAVPAPSSTTDATPTFGGTGGTAPGDSATLAVSVYPGASTSGTAVETLSTSVDPSGIFSVRSQDALASGTYTAVARQADSGGNVGRSAVTFTVDASSDPVLLAAGDIGSCSSSGDEATGVLLDSLPGTVAAVGDLAYSSGTTLQFLNCFDPSWGRQRARMRPAAGNHEYETTGAAPYFAFFGSAAGDPATGYYSYGLGGWHIVVLNAECAQVGGCGVGSPQEQWLKADLQAHPAACTLAYFHEPRFSSGEHGDEPAFAPFWQDLYDAGADVVLGGHDHLYERFAPQTPAGALDTARGLREFVVGTGGVNHGYITSVDANSEVRNADTYGVLSLVLHPGSYDWRFVPVAGGTFTDSGSQACH